jgi:hypothetical protein
LFTPKVATPQVPAEAKAAPTEATPSVQAAADAERMRQRRQRGQAATMLTGSQGAGTGNVGTTQLLGG